MSKEIFYIHDNSIPEEYYKQTNNERSPLITCFNTSMINAGHGIVGIPIPSTKDKTGDYVQPEDAFDWYMHNSEEVTPWVDKFCETPWVKQYLANNGDIRELWEVEAYCFNKWIGYDCCKTNYNMTKSDFIQQIQEGKAVVTTGVFTRFNHAVTVVGYKAVVETDDENAKDVKVSGENYDCVIPKDCNNIKSIYINDSYGNPNARYQPIGVGGFDVECKTEDFFRWINKSKDENKELFYGITFNRI